MTNTKIEWAEKVWNPLVGCSKVSLGCAHCYAERMAFRLKAMGQLPYQPVVDKKGRWTGKINLLSDKLDEPLRWRKPARIFVNSMSDLFHEWIFETGNESFVDEIFAIMAATPHHIYQILTKRPKVMRDYICNSRRDVYVEHALETIYSEHGWCPPDFEWPLPNVLLGVSVEDQKAADERIPLLLQTPAALRFLSCEPLLGPVDPMLAVPGHPDPDSIFGPAGVSWIIAGGESGPNARPMHPDWPRLLRDSARAAGIAFFFKQWGAWLPCERVPDTPGFYLPQNMPAFGYRGEELDRKLFKDRFHAWDPDTYALRLGKSRTGRLLDGLLHDQIPARSALSHTHTRLL